MATLPFALVGGIWLLYLMNYNLSVAGAVGFVALAGVLAEFGVIMLLCLRQPWDGRVRRARQAPKACCMPSAKARCCVCGMISAPLLSMFVISAAHQLMRRPRVVKADRPAFWRWRRVAT